MSKKLIAILVLAFVVGISAAAYAEVQNVKVSGDITVVPFSRNHLNLGSSYGDSKYVTGIAGFTKVKISANLTDNVDAIVGFANERLWTSLNEGGSNEATTDNVYLDCAYVSFKDFLKESTGVPLTMIIGRQPIKLGSGLLVGDPDTNQMESDGPLEAPSVGDLSIKKGFDAMVGVLDYNPLTITLGYVKGTASDIYDKNDDINVWAAVAAYNFGEDYKNLVGELTFVQQSVIKSDNVNNVGARFTAMPFKDLGMEVEYVYQTAKKFGVFDYNSSGDLQDSGKSRASDAIRVNATFALPDVKLTPSFGLDYTRLSRYWNVMHEDMTPANIMNLIFPNQNVQLIGATLTLKPMKDLTTQWRFASASMAKESDDAFTFYSVGTDSDYDIEEGEKDLGYEIDSQFTYDYTSDVQFGFGMGYFKPGKAFHEDNDDAVQQIMGSMKVTF
jgi:hypothetical protein